MLPDMKPSLKYWIFIFVMACAIFGVILASVLGSWLNLDPHEQAFLLGLSDRIIPFPIMGALFSFKLLCMALPILQSKFPFIVEYDF